jgi:hypothetical protein
MEGTLRSSSPAPSFLEKEAEKEKVVFLRMHSWKEEESGPEP